MGGSRHLVGCSITYKAYGSHLSNNHNLAHIHQESLLEWHHLVSHNMARAS